MRIHRGLWADLETTVIHQDRQFLTEVAKTLGLPVQEVLKKCLGNGVQTPIIVLEGDNTDHCCPWSMKIGHVWTPCSRVRLTESSACYIHRDIKPNPTLKLTKDLDSIPTVIPVEYNDVIYWWCPTNPDIPVVCEDGTVVPNLSFKYILHKGEKQLCAFRT
jgi:hypothetical protein